MGAGRGINGYTRLAADDNSVALAKVIANTAGSSFVQPDTIIRSVGLMCALPTTLRRSCAPNLN